MTSAGGLMALEEAAERPANLLVSGPAGGVLAGCYAASAAGMPDAITFDMGGTSTDVCLVRDGRPEPAAERWVAGLPIRLPALDVHTIGAGGGSIARIDPGGALVVGPESAGADPGPACYGRGGERATVTDADLVAGRIPEGGGLGGLARLDIGRGPAGPRWCRRRRRGGHHGGGRHHGAGIAPGLGRTGRGSRRAWPWSPSGVPARCTPAPWPRRSTWPQ